MTIGVLIKVQIRHIVLKIQKTNGAKDSFSKELLNPELKNLRTITQEEKHKYVTQFDQILASKTTTIPKNVNKLHVSLEEKKFALSLESKTISELTEYIEYSIKTASQELSDFLANYRNEKLRKTCL